MISDDEITYRMYASIMQKFDRKSINEASMKFNEKSFAEISW